MKLFLFHLLCATYERSLKNEFALYINKQLRIVPEVTLRDVRSRLMSENSRDCMNFLLPTPIP